MYRDDRTRVDRLSESPDASGDGGTDIVSSPERRRKTLRWKKDAGDIMSGRSIVDKNGNTVIINQQNAQIKNESLWKKVVYAPGRAGKWAIKNPGKTVLISLAALAAGFALAGNWELLMTKVGAKKVVAGAEAAKKITKPTIVTPKERGGGVEKVKEPMPLKPEEPYRPS